MATQDNPRHRAQIPQKTMPTEDKGTTDESIGRPGVWREGRYQQSGEALDNSVTAEQAASEPKIAHQPVSTPVHLDEYTTVDGAAALDSNTAVDTDDT